MEYTATYDIDGGVSHGFGFKEPDRYTKTEKFEAEGPAHARNRAFSKAMTHAIDSLSNPETDLTKVTILDLKDSEGKRIEFPVMNCATCDMLSHGLIICNSSLEERVKAKLKELDELRDYADDSTIRKYLSHDEIFS